MANLLERASVVLTPTAYNNGEALCIKPSDGSGDFQFSRNSAATRVNAQGLVENVQILSSNLVQNGDFSEEGAEEVSNGSFTNGSTDWTLGTGWSIAEDKAVFIGSSSGEYLVQNNVYTLNSSIKLTFDVLDYVSGSVRIIGGGSVWGSGAVSSNGTHTFYIDTSGAVNNNIYVQAISGVFNGSITNISVKEVGMDWALGSGWSIGENKVVAVNGNSYGTFQGGVTQTNKNYKVTYTIEDYISGTVNLRMHTLNLETRNSNGTFTEYFTSVGSSLYIQGGNNFNGSITNISVIEITDDTNLPRINYEGFSYDGSGNIVPNSGCGSWLFEPQSTNLITQSELFSDASWTKLSVSITPNSIISPDGTLNASLMSITGGTSDQRIFKNVTYSGTNVVSVFAKAGASNWLSIRIGSSVNKWYDLENGVLGGSTIVGAYVDADIQDYGNGWYRCSLVFTDNFTTSTRFYPADDDLVVTQSSGSVYIWGAQSEQQSYATSYIPTSGSQVTRNQDVCTGGGSLATINSTEGVLYAEIAALADDLTNRYITISDGTANNRLSVFFTTASNKVIFSLYVGGVLQSYISNSSTDITQINKIACKWKENDFALWINGVEVATDTNGITFPVNTLDRLDLSYTITNLFNFYGKTKAVAVWKEALSDAELTELTSN
jgi:hypothetical protein